MWLRSLKKVTISSVFVWLGIHGKLWLLFFKHRKAQILVVIRVIEKPIAWTENIFTQRPIEMCRKYVKPQIGMYMRENWDGFQTALCCLGTVWRPPLQALFAVLFQWQVCGIVCMRHVGKKCLIILYFKHSSSLWPLRGAAFQTHLWHNV